MGLYRRNKRGRDGKLRQSFIWWMCYASDGKRHCESTKTTNKRLATRILNKRLSEIVEGKFSLSGAICATRAFTFPLPVTRPG